MCDNKPLPKLPILPGFKFGNSSKSKYHKTQCFNIKEGCPSFKSYVPGPGNSPRDVDSMQFFEYDPANLRIDPELTYGIIKRPKAIAFKPHFTAYDKKTLRFEGYFKELVHNSPDETLRVRLVDVLYYLEDDTLTVMEPSIPNSGLLQGRLVRRSRIPQGPLPDCDYLHWKDLNLGQEYQICGFLIRLTDCDPFTREFLTSQGVLVNEKEHTPCDDFSRKLVPPLPPPTIPRPDSKLKQFLKYDGIILRFKASWENGNDTILYSIAYHAADDTFLVSEISSKDSEYPIILKRTKIPKKWEKVEMTYPSWAEEATREVTDYYKPKDLVIGQYVDIFGRNMLLFMCDDFTRNYYKNVLKMPQPENIQLPATSAKGPQHKLCPYTGYGSKQDSLVSCLTFYIKEPRKNDVRRIIHANHYLRYKAIMLSAHPEDKGREFVLSYSLAEGTISIDEPPKRNSGHVGGSFLSPMLIVKPKSSPDYPEYYTPNDMGIGSIINVNEFRFHIIGADLHVYKYMQQNLGKFKPEIVESMRKYFEKEGLIEPQAEAAQGECVEGEN